MPLITATGCSPALYDPACAYIHVRAVSQPAVLATMVLQVGAAVLGGRGGAGWRVVAGAAAAWFLGMRGRPILS